MDNNQLEYTFPLGMDMLEDAINTNKLLFMRFMVQMRTGKNTCTMAYISTENAIRSGNVIKKCLQSAQLGVSLAERLKLHMLDGLLGNTSTTPEDTNHYIRMNMATPLTFLLRVNHATLTNVGYSAYNINVVTLFTIYFISNVKKDSVLRLLRAGVGFITQKDGSLYSRTG